MFLRIQMWLNMGLKLSAMVCLIAITYTAIRVGNTMNAVLTETHETMGEVKATATSVKEFVANEKKELESPKRKQLLDLDLAVGGYIKSVVNTLNLSTLPRLNAAITNVGETVQQLRVLTANTDESINHRLLPDTTQATVNVTAALTQAAKTLETQIAATGKQTTEVLQKADIAMQDIHAQLTDPSIHETMKSISVAADNVAKVAEKADATAAHLEISSAKIEQAAGDVASTIKSQSKWGKFLGPARLVAIVAPVVKLLWY